MKVRILLLLAICSLVVFGNEGRAQGMMRGEAPDVSTQELTQNSKQQLQLELLVEEIEEAGFELDVEEGFEEEWEEEIWVSTDEEEIDALFVDPDDNAFPEEGELLEEDVEGDWETVYDEDLLVSEEDLEDADLIYADAGMNFEEESMIWINPEDEEIDELLMEEEWYEDTEEAFDPGWEEVMEEWELEEMEFEMEDDLDLLEAIYNAG